MHVGPRVMMRIGRVVLCTQNKKAHVPGAGGIIRRDLTLVLAMSSAFAATRTHLRISIQRTHTQTGPSCQSASGRAGENAGLWFLQNYHPSSLEADLPTPPSLPSFHSTPKQANVSQATSRPDRTHGPGLARRLEPVRQVFGVLRRGQGDPRVGSSALAAAAAAGRQ